MLGNDPNMTDITGGVMAQVLWLTCMLANDPNMTDITGGVMAQVLW